MSDLNRTDSIIDDKSSDGPQSTTIWCEEHVGNGGTVSRSLQSSPMVQPGPEHERGRHRLKMLQEWRPADLAERYLEERGYLLSDGTVLLRRHQPDWLRFTGLCYEPISTDELGADILRYVHDTPARRDASPGLARSIMKNMEAWCLIPASVQLPAEHIAGGKWRPLPGTFVMANGILRLNKQIFGSTDVQFSPHTPSVVSRICLPFSYDEKAQCPRWLSFLAEILPDAGTQAALQELFGDCLIQGNRYQRFFLLQGSGANGKSVVTNTLRRVLHDDNVSGLPLNKLDTPHDLVATYGKLANVSSELRERDQVSEDVLKKWSGGDLMYFNPKYGTPFSAPATAKLIMCTNESPAFTDRTDGLWRRLLVLRFPVTIPPDQQNPNLEQELAEELPGILNWAIEGAIRLHRNRAYTIPQVSVNAAEELRNESNSARIFLTADCELSPGAEIESDVLFQAYREFCKAGEYRPNNRQNFLKEVDRVFPSVVKGRVRRAGKRPHVLLGLRLITP